MEINNINMQVTQTGSFFSPSGNGDTVNAPKSSQAALDDFAITGGSLAQQQVNSLTSSNYVKQQIQKIITTFPPYFPAGSPQRIDLIKGVKGVQDEIQSSNLSTELKGKFAGQGLTDSSIDKEVSTALKGIQQYTERQSSGRPQSTNTSQPAGIVSITV